MAPARDPDVQFLAALADPVRLSIVRAIVACADAVCACDFVECCTVGQPTISHHLRVMREAGVVIGTRRGTNIVYSLAPDFERRWNAIGAGLKGQVGSLIGEDELTAPIARASGADNPLRMAGPTGR